MSRSVAAILASASAIAGVLFAFAAQGAATTPVGRWYFEYEPDKGGWYSYTLWDIRADNTIIMHSRICFRTQRGFIDAANNGTWQLTDDLLTFAWPRPGRVSTGCTRYRVLNYQHDRWTYESLCTHNSYAMVRVTTNSEMPSCEMTS